MKLKDKTNMAISKLRKLGRIPVENIRSVEQHRSVRRRIQTAKKMQQRAFPCTRRTNHAHQLSAFDADIQILENQHLRRGVL